MMLWGQNTNIRIENNIFANCLTWAAETYQTTESGTTFITNLLYNTPDGLIDSHGGSVSETGNLLNKNPLFVNPAAYDYHLQSGSPAIGAGSPVSLPPDFAGIPVPSGVAVAIGALQP